MTPYSDLFRAMETALFKKNSVLITLGYSFANWIQSDNVGTGTGMGKIIKTQDQIEQMSRYVIDEKSLFLILLNIVNSIKRRVGIIKKLI